MNIPAVGSGPGLTPRQQFAGELSGLGEACLAVNEARLERFAKRLGPNGVTGINSFFFGFDRPKVETTLIVADSLRPVTFSADLHIASQPGIVAQAGVYLFLKDEPYCHEADEPFIEGPFAAQNSNSYFAYALGEDDPVLVNSSVAILTRNDMSREIDPDADISPSVPWVEVFQEMRSKGALVYDLTDGDCEFIVGSFRAVLPALEIDNTLILHGR